MLLIAIIICLLLASIIAMFTKNSRIMEQSSVAANIVALIFAFRIAFQVSKYGTYNPFAFISIDALGSIVLLIISVVALATAAYAVPFMRKEEGKKVIGAGRLRQYYALVDIFLILMYLAVSTSYPVAAWIFLETTTLSTVFLISYYNKRSSIEAAWKYLIINSIGLLLAFFGTLLYLTSVNDSGLNGFITWQSLLDNAHHFDPAVAKVAFIFVLIGYGTKIGFAPMHTWKPDTYSKSPVPLGALFSGALMPVAFVVLLRFKVITDAAIGPLFGQHLFIVFGILSILVAALSMLSAKNYKRLLAYSSIEHAGIIALGFGFGGLGVLASILHIILHSLIKPALFFVSGNILLKYHSARINKVRGALGIIPINSVIYLIGLFAITGLPPFGIFKAEILNLASGISNYPIIVYVALFAMAMAFIGFFRQATAMIFRGKPDTFRPIKPGEKNPWLLIPPLILLSLALLLSFWMPQFMQTLIHEATIGF